MKTLLKISFLFLTIFVSSFSNQAQSLITEACNDGLRVRQIPGSNIDLSNYLDNFIANDTIHAIIFPPANCPRCESLINPILCSLKKLRPNIPTVLISAYSDSIAAQKYIDRYALTPDYIIFDTNNDYTDIFSFDSGYLHIPYLLKIVPSTGDLIIGLRADDSSDDLLNEFCQIENPIEKKKFDLSKEYLGFFKPSEHTLELKRKYTLSYPDTVSLSEIIYQPEFYKNKLFFNDKLREDIVYFEVSEKHPYVINFKREIKTDSDQNKAFVQIPDSMYYPMVHSHDVRFIPLSPKMIDDHTLAISYSLPKLWYTSAYSIGYMNQASVLIVNPDSTQNGKIIPFIKDNNDGFFYPHFNLFKYGEDLAIGCERLTWPMEFEKEEYVDTPEFNPFSDGFYSFSQPIVALFDKNSGNIKERICNLPEYSNFSKTGYYFISPVIESFNQEIVISDGFSGELNLLNINDPKNVKKYKVFDIPYDIIPKPIESSFYSYDCVAPYINVFNRNIIDIKLSEDNIYCLIRYGLHGKEDPQNDKYSVIEINRDCNCITEKGFNLNNDGLKYYGLRRTENNIEPFVIYKTDDNNWEVQTFGL